MLDLLSQVTLCQRYTNIEPVPIECVYTFPVDAAAAGVVPMALPFPCHKSHFVRFTELSIRRGL